MKSENSKLSVKIIGPYVTNYSLARVNRGLALALSSLNKFETYLYQHSDKLDKTPDTKFYENFPSLKNVVLEKDMHTDIAIYNDFPKGGFVPHEFSRINADFKIMYIAWEESIYPKMWVDEINNNLNAVVASSSFVENILKQNGVKVPIFVVPNAIDSSVFNSATQKYPLNTNKKFKFLHVSTGRVRKGVDVLLKAYFQTFTKKDDVSLIIKSFPSPDNLVNDLLKQLSNENSPEVVHINNPDLSEQELVNLINTCDVAVYPSRAEGFGLPQAESMFHKKPLIATNYSAYLDFVNEGNAFLLDYDLKDTTDSEFVNIGAKWAEPSIKDLSNKMKYLFENISSEEVKHKVENAYESAKQLNWNNSAKEFEKVINLVYPLKDLRQLKLAVITPINSFGGIEIYSEKLYSSVKRFFKDFYFLANADITNLEREDDEFVIRNWSTGEKNFEKVINFLIEEKINIVHIQYHSGFYFDIISLDNLIQNLKALNIKIFVTLHAVKGSSFDYVKESKNLKLTNKVFIHSKEDFEYASKILPNTYHLEHPNEIFPKRDKSKLKKDLDLEKYYPIIATHGLMNSNKNIPEIIKALPIILKKYPESLFLGLNAVISENIASQSELEKCKSLIKDLKLENNVVLVNNFLVEEQVILLMQVSDVVVFNYSDVGESASAAVRKSLGSLTHTIVTDIKMFDSLKDEVQKYSSTSSTSVAEAILTYLDNRNKFSSDQVLSKLKSTSYQEQMMKTLNCYNVELS